MEGSMNVTSLLVELIINNTRLSYDKNELKIDNDTAIMEILKIIAKPLYEKRLQELQEKENSKEE